MAAEYFNSLGGFSVGLPEIPVIDANGNVITNVNTTGNVTANVVYATYYRWANGQPFNSNPGGSSTQLQYNNNGSFAGIPDVTYSGGNLNLGNISNVKILGGTNGYVLQTDGTGNLSWVAGGGGGGNGSPGGSNSQIQFNDAGSFGADVNFTYNNSTDTVNLVNLVANGEVSLGSISNVTITGGTAGYYLRTDGLGNLSWDLPGGGGNGTPGGSNTQVQFNDEGEFAGDTTFTFDKDTGILTIPILSATTVSAGGIQTAGNITAGNIKANTLANITGNLRVTGNVNFSGAANVTLGSVANLKISGGTNGYVLTTDGLGNLTWEAGGGGGGNGTPGGANTQVQFNNNGTFAGDPNFVFNPSTDTVTVGGNLIANSLQIGSGVYKFCTSEVYFASTASATPNQLLYSIPVADLSGVDFHIIATDSIGSTRQSAKISSIYYAGAVQFNEYAGLQINGGVGSFSVDYDAGNIVNPPSLQLKVSPDSSHMTIYRMMITVFSG